MQMLSGTEPAPSEHLNTALPTGAGAGADVDTIK